MWLHSTSNFQIQAAGSPSETAVKTDTKISKFGNQVGVEVKVQEEFQRVSIVLPLPASSILHQHGKSRSLNDLALR